MTLVQTFDAANSANLRLGYDRAWDAGFDAAVQAPSVEARAAAKRTFLSILRRLYRTDPKGAWEGALQAAKRKAHS